MKNSAGKGDLFRDEATKALNKKSLFSFLDGAWLLSHQIIPHLILIKHSLGGSKKFEDASELFTKAGNAYKLGTY